MSAVPKDTDPDIDKRSRLIGLSDVELELLTRKVADGIRPECGESLKKLRLKAGLTQTQAGAVIRRAVNTVSDWENNKGWPTSNAHLPLLLQEFGVPGPILVRCFGSENIDESLSPRAYLKLDATGIAELEANFFKSQRGKMLFALTRLALSGSPKHMEMWYDRMRENAQDLVQKKSISASLSKPKLLERTNWVMQSMSSSGSSSNLEPKPKTKPSSNGSKKKTIEPARDSEVQPDNIPGV
jgi:transcriptional regulator with XRE-family HTH domain